MNRDFSSPMSSRNFECFPSVDIASELFCSDVIASWQHSSGDNPVPHAVQGLEEEGGIGYWPEYSEEIVASSRRLHDTDHQQGRNSHYMRVEELEGSTSTERAFVIEHPSNDSRENAIERAQSRLATWALVDSLGINVPRHVWLEESEELVVEGITTDEVEAQTVYGLSHPEWVSQVSTTALLDKCGIQLLAGNTDLGQMNVGIDEDGGVHVFDFDRAGMELSSPDAALRACSQAKRTARVLGDMREDDGALISKPELLAHTRTLATRLQTEFTEYLESALEVVRQYDAVFVDETSRQFADIFENNVECLSE